MTDSPYGSPMMPVPVGGDGDRPPWAPGAPSRKPGSGGDAGPPPWDTSTPTYQSGGGDAGSEVERARVMPMFDSGNPGHRPRLPRGNGSGAVDGCEI